MLHRTPFLRVAPPLVVSFLLLAVSGRSDAAVCLVIDEAHDTFSAGERTSALLLLTRQFEREGEEVVPPDCENRYEVAHIRLGNTISITLKGPKGVRDSIADGLDDVPTVYSQMVRSLVRGVPMESVVDRTNVSERQSRPANRVRSDSLTYAKLGFGSMFGDRTYSGPAMTLIGYRRELDRVAVDISFFSYQRMPNRTYYAYASSPTGTSGNLGSWLKFLFLRFNKPLASRSLYGGGGLSWTTMDLTHDATSWEGNGLQGEVVGGYEIGRASTVRVFLETGVGLPLYQLTGTTVKYSNAPPYVYSSTRSHRWTPSATVSLGVGWQRGGR